MPFPFLQAALSFATHPLTQTAMSAYAASRAAKAGQTDLVKLRNEANRAGFNPLTVLRATGGQGFNNTGGLASAAFIGAFSRLGDNIAQAKQAKATLANTIANTNYTGILAKQAVANIGANSFAPGTIGADSSVFTWQMKNDLVSNYVAKGMTIAPETTEKFPPFLGSNVASMGPIPSAQAIEDEYGDLASWVYFLPKSIADIYTTGVLSGARSAYQKGKTFGFGNKKRGQDIIQNNNLKPSKPPLQMTDQEISDGWSNAWKGYVN